MTHPYRDAPAVQRPLAWLLRFVPALPEFRWYRRAVGGHWVHGFAQFIPGCPECWFRPEVDRGLPTMRGFAEEWWP